MFETIDSVCLKAREASFVLASSSGEEKNKALMEIAKALVDSSDKIIDANRTDLENGRNNNMSQALLDRLMLNRERIEGIADAVREITAFPDPVGRVIDDYERPNGLHLKKVSVPLGVIAVIYEARPNVTADSAALCLKSGNAVVLRGGKEAINSNIAIASVMREALKNTSIPADAIQLIENTSRESADEIMAARGKIDVLIPRGGKGLIKAVVEKSKVPVIETGAGVCHVYVDKEADIEMAANIVFNAKTSRPSVCNAAECMLIHKDIAEKALPVISSRLKEKNVEIRADELSLRILGKDAVPANESDFGYEFGDYIISCKIVDSVYDAISHIRKYSSGHSEAIVTNSDETAEIFMRSIDSAALYHNASTRFTDGGVFGLGAEIGISTQKLHARGPLGLKELTSTKYMVYGNGQVR